MDTYGQMNHCQRVLYRLKQGPLDPLASWKEIGVYRLAARVHDLKAQGYAIDNVTTTVVNHYGESCRVAQYFLLKSTPSTPSNNGITLSERATKLFK